MASVIRGSGASTLGGALDVQGVLTYEDVTSVDSIGIITARSGINVGTGASISSPDTNELALGTNNAERLRIASGGSVGIGTNAPVGNLEIRDTKANLIVAKDGLTVKSNSDLATQYDLIQLGAGGALASYSIATATADTQFIHNAYRHSGGNWKYRYADTAMRLRMNSPANTFIFESAASGSADADITFSEKLSITSDGDVSISSTGTVHGVSKLTLLPADRTSTFDASNGDTWHDVVLMQNGNATNNAVGIAFEVGNSGSYHKNAGTGICAVKNGTNSDYGADLVFVTRPQSAVAQERLRITSTGQLQATGAADVRLTLGSGGTAGTNNSVHMRADGANLLFMNASGGLTKFESNGTETLRITDAGKIGINIINPTYMLEVQNNNPGNDSKQLIQRWVNNSQNTLELHMYGGSVDQVQFAATNSEQTLSFLTGLATGDVASTETSLLLTQNRDVWAQGPASGTTGGGLFIGREASPYGNLCVLRDTNRRPLIYLGGAYPEITLAHTVATNTSHGSTIRFVTYVQSTNTATGNQFVIGTNGTGTFLDIGHATAAQNANVHNGINSYNGTHRFRVTTSGCQVNGSLSKSSGSFRIDHPVVGLSTTHDLVHSFIEGPQADLIYRGVVDLVDGTATVNIDTAGRMTEGTFEVLCTNVSCFTSNETDWTAVKGSVSGNILTITAQDNTSTATVSWMVVGERKDPHMIDTDWTDENGRVITEPLKSAEGN